MAFALLLLMVVLTGCNSYNDKKPLADNAPKRPVILIPGMQGSRLVAENDGSIIWGSNLGTILDSSNASELALPTESLDFARNADGLRLAGIIEGGVVRDFYGQLIETLERGAGYTCVSPDEIGPTTDCVLFDWDWRRDMVEAAANLEQTIMRLRAAHSKPGLKVDIIGHSAGGLIARYYLRYGGKDILEAPLPSRPPMAGADRVHSALLIATPNNGSIYGLQRLMRGVNVGLFHISPRVTATMPSVYQLLPHPERQWMIDLKGDPVWINLYDVATWRKFGEGIFRSDQGIGSKVKSLGGPTPQLIRFFDHALKSGERFQRALSTPIPSVPTRYVLFGSGCKPTPSTCLLTVEDGRPAISLSFEEADNLLPGVDYRELMLDPGDGRVTVGSLRGRLKRNSSGYAPFPVEAVYLGCDDHSTLPSNPGLISSVLEQLAQ